jgi:hypothetical protein
MEDVEERVAEIRRNAVAPRSRLIYHSSSARFVLWLYTDRRELITPDFLQLISDDEDAATVAAVKKLLAEHRDVRPLYFEQLTPQCFMSWIVSLQKRSGESLSYASYNSHRSAYNNLCRDYGYTKSEYFESELTHHFKGLKREVASNMASGVVSCKEGKDPLPFELYRYFGLATLKSASRDMIFGRTFLILSWNLMARAANTLSIRYEHMQFTEDCLCIMFAQMKTDQFADRPKDPRHVYANPIMPEVCPMLALGVMWLCYGFSSDSNKLFPGSRQYERFRHLLSRLLEAESSQLALRGIDKSDIGSHSIRKGCATYCSSGSTACPSGPSIDIRAGWAQGGVKGRYVKHQNAGDMFVGRTASGLPINDPQFSILPPHFNRSDDARDAIHLCFTAVPPQAYRVAEFALASVVFHREFLRTTLPESHSLFSTRLFTTRNLLDSLVNNVICEMPSESSKMQATGIPPHVAILNHITQLWRAVEASKSSQDHNVTKIIDGVIAVLDERAIGSGVVTRDMLHQEFAAHSARIEAICREGRHSVAPITTREEENRPMGQLYSWGGALHPVPETFELPSVSCRDAWHLWIQGDASKQYPPFRKLKPIDMPASNARKRLSDLRYLMQKVERHAVAAGRSISNLSPRSASVVFDEHSSVIDVSTSTDGSRKRRRNQLVWITVASILRGKEKKRKRNGTNDSGE